LKTYEVEMNLAYTFMHFG